METQQIDITTNIGDSYWGDSFSFNYLKEIVKPNAKIELLINSYGGDVLEALAIYNYLQPRDVTAKIVGYAASAATMIACAANEVIMPSNGFYMIHNPWSFAIGEADDLDHSAQLLRSMTAQIVNIYTKKTGLSSKKISDMMNAETWLTSKEAKSMGFVDKITEGVKIEASIRPYKFSNTPKDLLIKDTEMSTLKEKVVNFLNANMGTSFSIDTPDSELGEEMDKGVKNEIDLPAITASVSESVQAHFDTKLDELKSEFQNKMTEKDKAITKANDSLTKISGEVKALGEKNTELVDTIDKLTNGLPKNSGKNPVSKAEKHFSNGSMSGTFKIKE